MDLYSVVLGQAHRLTMALRRGRPSPSSPSPSASLPPPSSYPLLLSLSTLRADLTPGQETHPEWLPRIMEAFSSVATSRDTGGRVTAAALAAIRQLLLHGT